MFARSGDSAPWLAPLVGGNHDLSALMVAGGVVVAASSAAEQLFGRSVAGVEVGVLFADGSREKLGRALAAPGPASWELQIAAPGGAPRAWRFLVLPAGEEERVLIAAPLGASADEGASERWSAAHDALAGVARELSRRVRQVEHARSELQRGSASRDHFVAALSHELRTPLNALLFLAAQMDRKADTATPADVRREAQQLRRIVGRMSRLVEDLLAAARLESGTLVLHVERVSLAELASEALESLEAAARNQGVALELTASPETELEGDRMMLAQVLSNLVENAVRHAPQGSVVEVALAGTPGAVRCAVRDRGPGVPPQDRHAIFERFTQGARPGGAGLGLYLADQFVALHGGRIWVEDRLGGGAEFVFEIPRARPGNAQRPCL